MALLIPLAFPALKHLVTVVMTYQHSTTFEYDEPSRCCTTVAEPCICWIQRGPVTRLVILQLYTASLYSPSPHQRCPMVAEECVPIPGNLTGVSLRARAHNSTPAIESPNARGLSSGLAWAGIRKPDFALSVLTGRDGEDTFRPCPSMPLINSSSCRDTSVQHWHLSTTWQLSSASSDSPSLSNAIRHFRRKSSSRTGRTHMCRRFRIG